MGRPDPRIGLRLLRPAARGREAYVRDHLQTYRLIGSRAFDFDEERRRKRAERCFDRGIHPAGSARQLAAIMAARDRTQALGRVTVPTTVIHGEDDPLVNVSGGRATAQAIPGAELVVIPGMGHDMPPQLWPRIIGAIVQNARRAQEAQAA